MDGTQPAEAFDDELLSAYVDNELDEAQRAQVEQRLRDDPRARQLVADLQSLSETLRSLPREHVGKELRDAVLQQTEMKTVLVSSREVSSRRWLWAGMAVAATLFLMVYQSIGPQEERQLAEAEPQTNRAERSVPEIRALAGDALDVAAESESAEMPEEATEEFFLIHLTLADAKTGHQRFDELLASNGIDLERRPLAAVAAASPNRVRTYGVTAGKSPSVAAKAEVVLVEASLAQIESVLKECEADTRNWDALGFADQEDSLLPDLRWRGFERKGRAGGAAAALKTKALEQDDGKTSLSKSEEKEMKRRFTSRGKATRLGADWYELRGLRKKMVISDESRTHQFFKEDLAVENSDGTQQSSAESQIQVLFVLHAAESSGK